MKAVPIPFSLSRLLTLSLSAAVLGSPTPITAASGASPDMRRQPVETFSPESPSGFVWRVVDDGVMGGLSRGKFFLTGKGTAVFEGHLSLENNGGFSSVRAASVYPLDLNAARGLAVRVRGDGRSYQLRLESDARFRETWAVSFKADFATRKGEWVEVEVPFSAFEGSWRGRDLPEAVLDPTKIERIGILLADKNPGSFRLEIDWIKSYRAAEKPL